MAHRPNVVVRMNPATIAALDAAAARNGVTRSELIRIAVDVYLNEWTP